ncbi:MAG TPA: ABC transporter ATP-binding protein, partial [Candidatus Limnocylindrales bacterium]
MTAPRPDGDMVACDNLVRIYSVADVEVVALQGLDLRIKAGEMVAIVGASGSGKSTLLNILGGLDVPTAGQAVVDGLDLARLSRSERTRYRRRTVGMVWQQTSRNLLPHLDVIANIELPMVLDGRSNRQQRAEELLELVGLPERARHRPRDLSGGEQQRVAIAVALANTPSVILADEPTGELDSATAGRVYDLLAELVREQGCTTVLVSHDPESTRIADRIVRIRDGRVSEEWARESEAGDTIVVGRGGWLRLPEELLLRAGIGTHATARFAEGGVVVEPKAGTQREAVSDTVPLSAAATDSAVVVEAHAVA